MPPTRDQLFGVIAGILCRAGSFEDMADVCRSPCANHMLHGATVALHCSNIPDSLPGAGRLLEEGLQPLFQGRERLFIDVIDQAGEANCARHRLYGTSFLYGSLAHLTCPCRWLMLGNGYLQPA